MNEYQVQFIGGSDVGKTSIIDQFLRSEHDDVFNKDYLIRVSDELNLFSRYFPQSIIFSKFTETI